MGNLVTETPHSEMNAAIEVLDRYGVSREDLAFLRTYPDTAQKVCEYLKSRRALFLQAIHGSLQESMEAVREIRDEELLCKICLCESVFEEVQVNAAEKIRDNIKLFNIVVTHPCERVQGVALSHLSHEYLPVLRKYVDVGLSNGRNIPNARALGLLK